MVRISASKQEKAFKPEEYFCQVAFETDSLTIDLYSSTIFTLADELVILRAVVGDTNFCR